MKALQRLVSPEQEVRRILQKMLRLLQVLLKSGSGSDRNQQIRMHRLRHIRSSELPLRRMRIQVLYLVLSSESEDMVLMYQL